MARSYEQGVVAERLRWAIRELAEGDPGPDAERSRALPDLIERFIGTLRDQAAQSADSVLELDHINGFVEVYRELQVILQQQFQPDSLAAAAGDAERPQARLTEIRDEVDDAALAMEQYFRDNNRRYLAEADDIRSLAVTMTGAAAALTVLQFVIMVVLLRRWVTKPMEDLEHAAERIGAGHLDVRIRPRSEREWQTVARAVHEMARSLSTLQQQLRVNERFTAIGEVAAFTAHNIRNPLASIRMTAQVALGETSSNPGIEATLKDIIGCVDKMEQWIAGLLNFARPMSLTPSRVRFDALVDSVRETSQPQAAARGIRFACSYRAGETVVSADEALFEQALHAVVANAIEASPNGGIIRLTTECRPAEDRAWAAVTVTDAGPGIPEPLQPNIFKPFVTGKPGGSGLGLAQAKKILDLHLAEIDVSSRTGMGTSITIRCPIPEDEHGTDNHH
ncbi:MAG TPA: ATP-binding protein [bacterium]|nr:ATP-binding protein [bacterium]